MSVVAATVLGDELRACDDTADIFADDSERRFAKEILQQIGRDLVARHPLGHSDMAALVVFHNTANLLHFNFGAAGQSESVHGVRCFLGLRDRGIECGP